MKDNYKSVEDLTPDQFAELRNSAECDLMSEDSPAEWWNTDGSLKGSVVKKMYADTVFTDDDFLCTAYDAFGETVNGIEAEVA